MAQLTNTQVFKKDIQTIADFAKAMNVSESAVYQAIETDKVDYVMVGERRMIVLSKHTMQYKPNQSPLRKSAKKIVRRNSKSTAKSKRHK